MFGVSDVHADTVSTYKLVGTGIARGAAKMARDAEKAAERIKSRAAAGDQGKGQAATKGQAAERSPVASPERPRPKGGAGAVIASPGASSPVTSPVGRAELAAAKETASARGHSTFARLIAEREASAPGDEETGALGGSAFEHLGAGEFDSDGDDDDDSAVI